jgi:zinc and cadmium transporter
LSTLGLILAATFVVSLIAFIGVLTFFLRQELLNRALMVLVALSAGALVGGAFLHLLPEAIEEAGPSLGIFLFLLLGFCLFFILEQFLHWRHEHSTAHEAKPFSLLILVSDAVHNFIDGLVIAAGFISGYQIGLVTTLAVALHEIPQELGDFGVLVYGGFGRSRALVFNYISAITAILGGVVGYLAGSAMQNTASYLLSFAAGAFIYVAAADLIPEIKHATSLRRSIMHFGVFLVGLGIMLAFKYFGLGHS